MQNPQSALLVKRAGAMAGGVAGLCGMRDSRPVAFLRDSGRFQAGRAEDSPVGRHWNLARIETAETAKALLATRLPLIAMDLSEGQLAAGSPLRRLSELASDSHQASRLAAEHLLARGFRHYAFVGIPGRVWSARREEGFCQRIGEAGFVPHLYPTPRRKRDWEWAQERRFWPPGCDVCPSRSALWPATTIVDGRCLRLVARRASKCRRRPP